MKFAVQLDVMSPKLQDLVDVITRWKCIVFAKWHGKMIVICVTLKRWFARVVVLHP